MEKREMRDFKFPINSVLPPELHIIDSLPQKLIIQTSIAWSIRNSERKSDTQQLSQVSLSFTFFYNIRGGTNQ